MNNHYLWRSSIAIVSIAAGLSFSSCVDDDYDLSKDIDMSVTVGGDLTLPPSSTEKYSIEQILDLNSSSSIKEVKPDWTNKYGLNDGDYLVMQEGSSSASTMHVDKVDISDLRASSSQISLTFMGDGSSTRVSDDVTDLTNNMNISDNNVDHQVVKVDEAEVNLQIDVDLTLSALDNYNGSVYIERGFEVAFPASWTIVNSLNDGCSVKDGHILVFNTERTVTPGQSLKIGVTVTKINLTNAGAGQGIYAPGKFNLDAKIVSNGRISISSGALAAGETTRLSLTVRPSIPYAIIYAFTGVVNPDITVNPTSVKINDIPSFLTEGDNNLDINNPRLYVTVENTSSVDVDINGVLTGRYANHAPIVVGVGANYGTAPVTVKASGKTVLCLSRLGEGANTSAGEINIKVEGLGELISTIPDEIEFDDVTAKVPQNRSYHFELGRDYDFKVDYQAIIPLAFGPELSLTYSSTNDGWDEDLDKYNFSKIQATVKVENTVPMNMVPKVNALDKHGNIMRNVTATISGSVAAGSVENPVESELVILLESTAVNLGEIGGIEYLFEATSSAQSAGIPLNSAQAIRFTDIRLKLIGGVDIDLN